MKDKTYLMIPGPTPVPQSVLLEMAKHPIGHRSSEFSVILKEVYRDLKWAFETRNDVFVYTASGTGAMEGALGNLVNAGDKVLSLVIGNFGDRWAKIARSRGAEVQKLEVEYGQSIDPDDLQKILDEDIHKDIKIVTMTHNETSTGVTNDIERLCAIIKAHGAISVVDGVTSIGALPCKMDKWGIDVLVSGSQKGFMVPPGLSFISASEKAMSMYEKCNYPSFYFDFGAHKKAIDGDTTPFTPNVNLIIALREALKIMKEEGLENIQNRHKRHAFALRKAIRKMGLKLFVEDDKIASNAITAILPPEGVSVPDIRKIMKENFDIVVANGQNQLKDRIFRMGTLGFVCDRDIIASVGSLEATLYKLGHKFEAGSGVKAVIEELMKK